MIGSKENKLSKQKRTQIRKLKYLGFGRIACPTIRFSTSVNPLVAASCGPVGGSESRLLGGSCLGSSAAGGVVSVFGAAGATDEIRRPPK